MKTDYSSSAIERRLREVFELARLGQALRRSGDEVRETAERRDRGSVENASVARGDEDVEGKA